MAFIDAGHDVTLRRIIAVGLLAQASHCHGEDLAAAAGIGSAARQFEILAIPGLTLLGDVLIQVFARATSSPKGATACTIPRESAFWGSAVSPFRMS